MGIRSNDTHTLLLVKTENPHLVPRKLINRKYKHSETKLNHRFKYMDDIEMK